MRRSPPEKPRHSRAVAWRNGPFRSVLWPQTLGLVLALVVALCLSGCVSRAEVLASLRSERARLQAMKGGQEEFTLHYIGPGKRLLGAPKAEILAALGQPDHVDLYTQLLNSRWYYDFGYMPPPPPGVKRTDGGLEQMVFVFDVKDEVTKVFFVW